jgi:hypothetical protein
MWKIGRRWIPKRRRYVNRKRLRKEESLDNQKTPRGKGVRLRGIQIKEEEIEERGVSG